MRLRRPFARPVARPVAVLASLAALAGPATAGGCARHTVTLAFQPEAGARYTYEVEVESAATTRIPGENHRDSADAFVLTAHHRVLNTTPAGTRVEVRLAAAGRQPRTFVVRLDRAAQLTEVQRIEGLPAQVLGNLGLSEIFPAAAGAPPRRALAPGDRWLVNEPLRLSGGPPVRLRGEGRLAALGVVDGRDVATIESTISLPVRSVVEEGGREIDLVGSQRTVMTTTHTLADGAVETAQAVTRGRFEIVIQPPEGSGAPPVRGELDLTVRSTTRRLA